MRRYFRTETVAFVTLWLLLLAAGRSRLLRDPGTFWHTVVGQDILATGELPRADRFSFTFEGQPWIASNWLGESLMAAVHAALGWDGLLLATVTLLAALYAWLAGRLARGGLAGFPTALLVGLAVAAAAHHFHVRTHLATLVAMPLTLALLCDVESGRAPLRRLGWLVPLFVAWTNLHGGVLAALAMVWVAAAGWCAWRLAGWESAIVGRREGLLVCGVLACCGLALPINPYGLEMPRTWLRIVALDLPDLIEEHAPLDLASPEGRMTLVVAALYLAALATLRRRPRVAWLLPLLWLYLAAGRVRHAPLFALTATVALADLLPHTRFAGWLARRGWLRTAAGDVGALGLAGQREHHRDWRPALVPALLVLTAVVLQAAGASFPLVGRGWARLDSQRWPVELLPELQRLYAMETRELRAGAFHASYEGMPANRPARLFNSLGLGGFAIYHAPQWQVFIDDRCELFGGEFLREYARAERAAPQLIDRWADEYGFRVALVKAGSAFDRYLASSPDWSCAGRAPAATLYRRDESSASRGALHVHAAR